MDTKTREMLVTTLGLSAMTQDEQDAIIQQVGQLIFQGVLLRIAPSLSEEAQNTLERLLDTDAAPEELFAFLRKENPDFDKIAAEETANLKAERDAIMRKMN